MINVGIIGCGRNFRVNHLPVLMQFKDSERIKISYVCDIDLSNAESIANILGAEVYSRSYDACLSDEDVDAVCLNLPPELHYQLGSRFLNAGKHILVEKPPANSVAQAYELAQLATRNKKLLSVGLNRRFDLSINKIKEILDGRFITACEASFSKPLSGKSAINGASSWFFYNTIHAIDTILYVNGNLPTKMYSLSTNGDANGNETVSVLMYWDNGAQATLTACNTAGTRQEDYRFHCRDLTVDYSDGNLNIKTPNDRKVVDVNENVSSFYLQLDDFFKSIYEKKTQARNSIDTIISSLVIAELALKGHCGPINWSEMSTFSQTEDLKLPIDTTENRMNKINTKKPRILLMTPNKFEAYLSKHLSTLNICYLEDIETATGQYKATVEGIITGPAGSQITTDLLNELPNIKGIGVVGASIKKYNLTEAFERQIVVFNASNEYAKSVAEFNLMLAILGLTRASISHDNLKVGIWNEQKFNLKLVVKNYLKKSRIFTYIFRKTVLKHLNSSKTNPISKVKRKNLRGKEVGIIGFGEISKEFIKLLSPLDCKVKLYSSHQVPNNTILKNVEITSMEDCCRSDVIVMQRGLNPQTVKAFGAKQIDLFKPGAVFINTGRGELVDEDALVARLRTNDIFACLDVFDTEPLPPSHPFTQLPNVFLTSHIAGSAPEMKEAAAQSVVENMRKLLQGGELSVDSLTLQKANFMT